MSARSESTRAFSTASPTVAAAQVRPATAHDFAAVERLLVASGLPLDGVRDALPTFVVAEAAGGDVVGVAGLEVCCDNALLRSVAVASAMTRATSARPTPWERHASAEARDIRALYLLTTTAERYFPAFGFREIGRAEVPEDVRATAEFRSACPASATVMARPLGEG